MDASGGEIIWNEPMNQMIKKFYGITIKIKNKQLINDISIWMKQAVRAKIDVRGVLLFLRITIFKKVLHY